MSKQRSVLIMAGGTGGHVFPALAVAERLHAHGTAVTWMGTRRGLEAVLVPKAGIPMEWIGVTGLRGKGLHQRLLMPIMLGRALWQAGAILRRLRPAVVLGMGGFASGPGGLMARLLGIPLIVHEQNAIAGLTNRWLARVAGQVLEAFPTAFPAARQAVTVGNPVRETIASLPPPKERFTRRRGRQRRLLVLGGSQGALALNQRVPRALALFEESERPEVWHQAGGQLHEAAEVAYREAGVPARLTPFIEDMAEAYGWADLVLCRAGALTIAELAAAGIGAVLVPFPFAVDDHQTANARFLEQDGAACVCQQAELTAERLAAVLRELLSDPDRLLRMAEAARRLAKMDAAEQVALACLEQVDH
ncbi:MAG TPA: undecaprenyldiphospho-muramoylpentapeptide beta-N-acetylglucosaminyltransferase [Candidatus Competibacteraceae bacterium]|nr:undecaprenyldiphospho-muramoylpentapeptide beta-N-acetylglucosaminyltransferase [Candidatus Competibacteraceae bacterium]MCP5135026.1 undecaprenyldiphospho-muramoylpentapeptide beta-N-acetylglucosaminyltransferase [Gammaproteobacteria bacterium]HPF57467.1 undecaprenyldiphospho-muramoylpentapeptide beta-N-acetylglucosaminyltransferase [Candidatus Competibacteraceae bacterium]HRY17173.1 undecaprenyldiphospho-muramoylpentapeptide beta-N-acetylglucosaminyltransferase [Candidatus Competibacteracea